VWLVAVAAMGGSACKSRVKPDAGLHDRPTVPAMPERSATAKAQATPASEQPPQAKLRNEEASEAEFTDAAAMCKSICRRSEPLRCKNGQECMLRCESMAGSPVCSVQVQDLFKCLLRQPTVNWECDEDGIGAIRDPYCDKEQSKLVACIQSNSIQ